MNGNEIPYGYCHCGCGAKTNLSKWTDKRIGTVKGQPYKFLNGHSNKTSARHKFDKYAIKTEGCWEWSGHKDTGGYGVIPHNRKLHKAHRVSWELHVEPIPKGLSVLHKCDNPKCVNPAHLFLGTQLDNMRDCAAKGRLVSNTKRGEENHYAKLTSTQVTQMREIRMSTGLAFKKIAQQFDVSTMTAYRAITGQAWAHLEGL